MADVTFEVVLQSSRRGGGRCWWFGIDMGVADGVSMRRVYDGSYFYGSILQAADAAGRQIVVLEKALAAAPSAIVNAGVV